MRGGISNPPCMADTKREMPNAGKGMREGGNEGGIEGVRESGRE